VRDLDSGQKCKRLFIALIIPEGIRKSLFKSISGLYAGDREIRQVPVDNIHLTLKFLGDTGCDRIEKIAHAVKQTSEKFEKFYYFISEKPGAFPSLKSAGVMFAQVDDGSKKIESIFTELENMLCKIKIRKEPRKFVSHITLARIRNRKDLTISAGKLMFEVKNPVLCSKIALFESVLKPSGAEYMTLNEFELK